MVKGFDGSLGSCWASVLKVMRRQDRLGEREVVR